MASNAEARAIGCIGSAFWAFHVLNSREQTEPQGSLIGDAIVTVTVLWDRSAADREGSLVTSRLQINFCGAG